MSKFQQCFTLSCLSKTLCLQIIMLFSIFYPLKILQDYTMIYGLYFLPIFLIGFIGLQKAGEKLRQSSIVPIALIILIVCGAIFYFIKYLHFYPFTKQKFEESEQIFLKSYRQYNIEGNVYYSFEFEIQNNFASNKSSITSCGAGFDNFFPNSYQQKEFKHNFKGIRNIVIIINPRKLKLYYQIRGDKNLAVNNSDCPPNSDNFVIIYGHENGELFGVDKLYLILIYLVFEIQLIALSFLSISILQKLCKDEMKYENDQLQLNNYNEKQLKQFQNLEDEELNERKRSPQEIALMNFILQKYMPSQTFQQIKQKYQINKDKCQICELDLLDEEKVRFTVCNHLFHNECLEKHLETYVSCPFCNQSFQLSNVIECQSKNYIQSQSSDNKL